MRLAFTKLHAALEALRDRLTVVGTSHERTTRTMTHRTAQANQCLVGSYAAIQKLMCQIERIGVPEAMER
jgi:hypothetical protein